MGLSSLLIASMLLFAEHTKPEPLIVSLPDDGVWTKFQVTARGEGADASLTFTVRSVGKTTHDGKPCRCLELEQHCDDCPDQILIYRLQNTTWRLIIPEDEFGAGKDPISHAVKVWQQLGDSEPTPVSSLAAGDPLLATLLKGPLGELKIEDSKEKVAWQRGTLDCQVLTGRQEIDFAGAAVEITSRILRHADVPFSTAGTTQELNASVGGTDYKVVIKAVLRDYGKDAKPKLPHLLP